MHEQATAEYQALRATIQARGTARTWIFVAGLSVWAALNVGIVIAAPTMPFLSLPPLLVLAGTFEAVFAIHVGVERLGRYLQVFHHDLWEQTAMAFGAPLAGTGADPLFVAILALATMCNFVPVLTAEPAASELIVLGGLHAALLVRMARARRAARRQRAADAARFDELKRKDAAEVSRA